MKVQVIGLPGSGKTWAISQFLKQTYCPITKLDIRDYKDMQEFQRSCISFPSHLIIESACGVFLDRSFIIHLKIERNIREARLISRDNKIDYEYIRFLETEIMDGDLVVSSPDMLIKSLGKIFGSRNGSRPC